MHPTEEFDLIPTHLHNLDKDYEAAMDRLRGVETDLLRFGRLTFIYTWDFDRAARGVVPVLAGGSELNKELFKRFPKLELERERLGAGLDLDEARAYAMAAWFKVVKELDEDLDARVHKTLKGLLEERVAKREAGG